MVKPNAINFVAEIGLNHNGSIDLAKHHIEAAKESGATTVKFQTYNASTRSQTTPDLYDIFKSCEFNVDQYFELKVFCDEINIHFASTAFCIESAQMLDQIKCKFVKVASFQHAHTHLLESIIKSESVEKIFVSTGTSNLSSIIDINNIYNSIKLNQMPSLVILHCISEYPISSPAHCHLINIAKIKDLTHQNVGFSDHSIGVQASSYAIILGATTIEKHFTIDNDLSGPDHKMSANPSVFKEMVTRCSEASEMIGEIRGTSCYEFEKPALRFTSKH